MAGDPAALTWHPLALFQHAPQLVAMAESSRSFSVLSLGKLRMQDAWRLEHLHSQPRHRLYWVTRGQGRVTVNCITRGYGPNTAVFVPGGTQMAIELSSQVQGLELCLPLEAGLQVPDGPSIWRHLEHRGAGEPDQAIFEKIERRARPARGPRDGLALTGLRAARIGLDAARKLTPPRGRILRERTQPVWPSCSPADGGAVPVRTGHRGLTAAALDVTPTHLFARLQGGRGPTGPMPCWWMRILPTEARRLLRDTDMPARESQEGRLGFSSAAYFTRAFQQGTTMTPTEFRTAPRRF